MRDGLDKVIESQNRIASLVKDLDDKTLPKNKYEEEIINLNNTIKDLTEKLNEAKQIIYEQNKTMSDCIDYVKTIREAKVIERDDRNCMSPDGTTYSVKTITIPTFMIKRFERKNNDTNN